MKRLLTQTFVAVALLLGTACNNCITSPEGTTLTGVVKCGCRGVAGVAVTDGEHIVLTDENGVYNIASTKPYGVVYITTPSGYEPVAIDDVRQAYWARTTPDSLPSTKQPSSSLLWYLSSALHH